MLAVVTAHPVWLSAQASAASYVQMCESGELVHCPVAGLIYETGAAGRRDVPRAEGLYQRACSREVEAGCRRLEILEKDDWRAASEDEAVRIGYVADAYDGAPIGGAVVRIRGIAGVGERRSISDPDGRVILDPLPSGRHRVDVVRGGYTQATGEIPVPWDTDFLILLDKTSEVEEADSGVGRIYGRVTEEGSDAGVGEVDIRVLGDATTTRVVSGRDGRFQLSGLEPGPVVVELTRLGYEPRTTTVTVQPGRTVELQAAMSQQPIELPPIEVTVSSAYLERTGFYRRAGILPGEQLTYRDIERMSVSSIGDVLRRTAGITVQSVQIGWGTMAVSNRRPYGQANGRCALQPYYNGTPTVDYEVELVPPDELEAIEVYLGPNVPPEYMDQRSSSGSSCGVILIWTRDPRRGR